jgi:hypothetical protein
MAEIQEKKVILVKKALQESKALLAHKVSRVLLAYKVCRGHLDYRVQLVSQAPMAQMAQQELLE